MIPTPQLHNFDNHNESQHETRVPGALAGVRSVLAVRSWNRSSNILDTTTMRSIVITGANRGIGLELVKQLLTHPISAPEILIATTRNASSSKDLQEIAKKDRRLHILELDVSNYDSYPTFVSKVSDVVGDKGLTVLLNNAGILVSKEGQLQDVVDAEMLTKQYNTNTVAPILLTKACLPLLKKAAVTNSDNKFGISKAAILYMSSSLGSVTTNESGGYWGYRESKAALNIAARSITMEVKSDGIAVLILHPGWVQTDMGGSGGLLTPKESVEGLVKVILSLDEKINGNFIQYNGEPVPW